MAGSEATAIEVDEYDVEYVGGGDEHRLVVDTPDVTITVEGDPEAGRRQFQRHYAAAVGRAPEELESAVEPHPMPDPDELDSFPAGEFYGE